MGSSNVRWSLSQLTSASTRHAKLVCVVPVGGAESSRKAYERNSQQGHHDSSEAYVWSSSKEGEFDFSLLILEVQPIQCHG